MGLIVAICHGMGLRVAGQAQGGQQKFPGAATRSVWSILDALHAAPLPASFGPYGPLMPISTGTCRRALNHHPGVDRRVESTRLGGSSDGVASLANGSRTKSISARHVALCLTRQQAIGMELAEARRIRRGGSCHGNQRSDFSDQGFCVLADS